MRHCSRLLHDELERIEEWVGYAVEAPIVGCGHYGCVAMAEGGDRLLKLTVDPAEPLLAILISKLQREDSARGEMLRSGAVKIHKVARVTDHPWKYGRKKNPLYAIVREAVIPVEESASRAHSDPLAMWLRKKRRSKAARGILEEQLQQDMEEVRLGNQAFARPPGWMSDRTKELLDDIVDTLDEADKCKTLRARARKEARATGKMAELSSYPEGEPLGEAMIALLAGFDVPLRDVHIGNVGLRIEPVFKGVPVPAFVLFDFGHAELRRVPAQRIPILTL